MEPSAAWKHGQGNGSLRKLLVRLLVFAVIAASVRFAFLVTLAGESCSLGTFCFFSAPADKNADIVKAITVTTANWAVGVGGGTGCGDPLSKDSVDSVRFYASVFRGLIDGGMLSPSSRALCIGTIGGSDVLALKEVGVADSVGIAKKAVKPLVIAGMPHRVPFEDGRFDFVFMGGGEFDKVSRPADVAAEIMRTVKPEGFAVFHVRAHDTYSFHSFVDLFNSCYVVRTREVDGADIGFPKIREMVMKKGKGFSILERSGPKGDSLDGKCSLSEHKLQLVREAEQLIEEEPLKPWITLKRNLNNIKYLPSIVDISFRNRYIYVDIGARSYGSSIGSWFRKRYPKQNRTFDVYAIEADKAFHDEYASKKGVTLLPYAAWIRNETLSFEVNHDPSKKPGAQQGRGMGRIHSGGSSGDVSRVPGFDFAEWLKSTATENDFVVMKMDVEGTEFDLIPRLFETGAICLIDELFLECHYNRWQRCCPGERSSKYDKTYGQCLDLFKSLRDSGVLVHQWW
ncbi:hypothetical protein MLD38_029769 [Melastoma candidum]|uniref:Uncharacterized protein n=1 Tax=Melastoma candidum TaxID=119954 RepID=A0ACB9N6B6_9MYRT|nr:hypothetical protein MLD38_029769 [Melastoma candidum]